MAGFLPAGGGWFVMEIAGGERTAPESGDLYYLSPSGLSIAATISPESALFDQFYSDYDRAFVLANEKEERPGFAECLALNSDDAYRALKKRYGAFREYAAIVTDPATGARVAGANYIIFALRSSSCAGGELFSINLNYVFVNAAARNRGYLRRLIGDFPDLAIALFSMTNSGDARAGPTDPPRVYTFIEQNDPLRMPREDYLRDTAATGLDQVARIAMWGRLGARIVDFAYVQPALSANQQPDENLAYAVLGAAGDELDACILRDHLTRFFGISVLKGADPLAEPGAARQLSLLAQLCARRARIPLLEVNGLDAVRAIIEKGESSTSASLRELLRSAKPL